ncbi:uncharacterized protein BT62DRAFT_58129 [Guyanagaster necrorhizus]|uniref:Protein argonaute N-terminal domain-containing protein n=1 Tax=Guyanagaster necrorhizus TaxID=856835 RepID=A0A9P8AYV5_9AGAR|nr:uncharacterized protein BT62DRAFT_58129 [Guyanagaster necrorhizus MCA 3950]KAG7453289.1 hypothetical protein BT62DRAFT_58129 [Guyanagaster necrorhizus MCA 3950]
MGGGVAGRRPGFGTVGRGTRWDLNIPVYHYDVAMEKEHEETFNLRLIEALQAQYRGVFTRAAVYDGQKNLYTRYKLDFGAGNSRQFNVTMVEGTRASNFEVTITEKHGESEMNERNQN